MSHFVSPKELAHAIGASESSMKRWADNGHLVVHRTAGGHRRIPINEAVQFIRSRKLKLVRPDILGLSPTLDPDSDVHADLEPAERLHQLLVDGKVLEARGAITALFLGGMTLAEIADGPISYALGKIGEIWLHDREGIIIEHRAMEACISSINMLLPMVEPKDPASAPRAIGASLPGDPYVMPNLLASAVLTESGFNATNLGADLPISLLASEAVRLRPEILWVSASVVNDIEGSTRELDHLANQIRSWNGLMVIGGRESDRLQFADSAPISICSNMQEIVALAKGIRATSAVGEPAA